MTVPEFVDTYSDDVIYLLEARRALLTHPLRFEPKELLNASMCRLLAVFMIGSIETMLTQWRDKDHHNILDVYFGKFSNGERVTALCAAFNNAGIPVDPQIFDDYLAIKYLRNTIIHGNWKEYEKQWVTERGFPTDTRHLTKEHLDRIEHINQNMMFYIFLTSVPTHNANKPDKLLKLDQTVAQQKDETGILRFRDLDRIIWNNLDRIYERLCTAIGTAATSAEYNWADGLTRNDIESMPDQERKRRFYFAARKAGENHHDSLTRYRGMASEALAFWQEYWHRAIINRGIHEEQIEQSLRVLQSPEFAKLATTAPWCLTLAEAADDAVHQLLDQALGDGNALTSEDVATALHVGRRTWERVPNIMPVGLLTLCLPIVDPENTTTYLGAAHRAMGAFRLNCWWYSWVERHHPPTNDVLEFYDMMSTEFLQRNTAPQ